MPVMRKILILSLYVAVIASCNMMSNTTKLNSITLTGKVEKTWHDNFSIWNAFT